MLMLPLPPPPPPRMAWIDTSDISEGVLINKGIPALILYTRENPTINTVQIATLFTSFSWLVTTPTHVQLKHL